MTRWIFLFLLSAAAAAGAAEMVSVPLALPESPLYVGGGAVAEVDLPFAAGRPLDGAVSAAVRLRGEASFMRSICWNFGDYGGGQGVGREDAGLDAALVVEGVVVGSVSLHLDQAAAPELGSVLVDTTLVYVLDDPAALSAGAGSVVLTGLDCDHVAVYPQVCICDPSFRLDEAAFVAVLGEGVDAVPAAWGSLKARYR